MTTEATIPHVLGEATLGELEQGLRGQLVRPEDEGYDEARAIWNGAHDRRPALIVRCAGVADVMRAVDFARSENLVVAVRGGGVVVDLSPMNAVRVYPARRTAVAEGGCTWADFDHETQAFGLAVTGGLYKLGGTTARPDIHRDLVAPDDHPEPAEHLDVDAGVPCFRGHRLSDPGRTLHEERFGNTGPARSHELESKEEP